MISRKPVSGQQATAPRVPGILLVEDDPGIRSVLSRFLSSRGFAVWTAANGAEALMQYRIGQETIDLVLAVPLPIRSLTRRRPWKTRAKEQKGRFT